MLIDPTDENQQTKSDPALHSCNTVKKEWRHQQGALAVTGFHELDTVVTRRLSAVKTGGTAIYAAGG